MLQVVYRSVPRGGLTEHQLVTLLHQCRINNAIDGVTGLLYADNEMFVQAIEGPEGSVEDLMARILVDDRHSQVQVLSTRTIAEREFGGWSMAFSTNGNQPGMVREQLREALTHAPSAVQQAFQRSVALPATD